MRIALLMFVIACDSSKIESFMRRSANGTGPRNAYERDKIIPDDVPPLPARGVYVHAGILTSSTLILDADGGTLSRKHRPIDDRWPDTTFTLSAEEVGHLWDVAEFTWRSAPPKFEEGWADYSETIIVVDHDEAMMLHAGGPIEEGEPAASLSSAIYGSVKD